MWRPRQKGQGARVCLSPGFNGMILPTLCYVCRWAAATSRSPASSSALPASEQHEERRGAAALSLAAARGRPHPSTLTAGQLQPPPRLL